MATLTQWLGQFRLATSTDALLMDDSATAAENISVVANAYFIEGYTSESPSWGLLEHLNALCDATTNYQAADWTYEPTTGLINVSFAAETIVTWGDTGLRDLLGYTGDLSGASDYTATNEPRYCWRPDQPVSDVTAHGNNILSPSSMTSVQRSPDGTVVTVKGVALLEDAEVTYNKVAAARVRIPGSGTSVNKEFQQFFRDVIHEGEAIRLYPDRTLESSADFVTVYVGTDDGEVIGHWDDYCGRNPPHLDVYWDVRIPVLANA